MKYTEKTEAILKLAKDLVRDKRKLEDIWIDDEKHGDVIKKAYITMLKEYFLTLHAGIEIWLDEGGKIEEEQ